MARVSVATVSFQRFSSPPRPPISFSALESWTTHRSAFCSSSCIASNEEEIGKRKIKVRTRGGDRT